MNVYPIDESNYLFDGAKILMDMSYRNLNFAHILIPKESFDSGLAQVSLYRTNMIQKGFDSSAVDAHIDAIVASPKLEMFLDPYGVIKIGNTYGHDVDTLIGSNANTASAVTIQEISTYAAMGSNVINNLPGGIFTESDCSVLLNKIVELFRLWGPRHLVYMPELDDLEYEDVPPTKQRADLLRMEVSTNTTRFFRYFKGWDNDVVHSKIVMCDGATFTMSIDLDVLDNKTQDVDYGTDSNYEYLNHAISVTDPRIAWQEALYDVYASHIENLLKSFSPEIYGSLASEVVKTTLLANQVCTCKGMLHLGDFYLVGRPAGLKGMTYRTDIYQISQALDISEDVVIPDSRDEWYFTVDPNYFSLTLDLVSQEMPTGDAKTAVLDQKALMDARTEGVRCTLLESPKYLSQQFASGGAYAGLIQSGGATLGDYDVVPGVKYSDVVGDRYIDGYVTYDPAGLMAPRAFEGHLAIAKQKPWKYVIMPSSNAVIDGMWSTTVYNLLLLPYPYIGGSPVATLDSDQVKGLAAAGVLVAPFSEYDAYFDPSASDSGAAALTGISGMTMDTFIAGITDDEGQGIAYADKHVYDEANLTDDGFICSDNMNALQKNKVDIAYHGVDQTAFLQIALRALAVAPSKTDLIPDGS